MPEDSKHLSKESDDELVKRLQCGDNDALTILFERHAQFLTHFLHERGIDSLCMEDLLQETFLMAYRRVDRFRFSSSFRTWLMSIADARLASLRHAQSTLVVYLQDEGQPTTTPTMALPGKKLRQLAELWLSPRGHQTIFEPAIRDLQDEHREALEGGRIWMSRYVLIRGYYSFWAAVLAQIPFSLLKWITKLRKVG